jgi:hypothetical protein
MAFRPFQGPVVNDQFAYPSLAHLSRVLSRMSPGVDGGSLKAPEVRFERE